MNADCTCCEQPLEHAIDDLAMGMCWACIPPHSEHSDLDVLRASNSNT